MLARYRLALVVLLLISVAIFFLYGHFGEAKPLAQWKWMDVIGEGGTALMSGIWTLLILGSRPRGRVTNLLAGGVAAIMLGSWADCLDEFFAIPHAHVWDNWLESILTLGGMGTLTVGLYFWRQEQWSLNEHMQKRERIFREHRSFDRITQLANADYLCRQLHLEKKRRPNADTSLVLLDLDDFHRISREHGAIEGDRLLQAISHLLLLNLRPDDLLCRYAGDRFAILLPATTPVQAATMAAQLRSAVASLAHHTRQGACLHLSARIACAVFEGDEKDFLARLNHALENMQQQANNMAFA